MSAVLFDGLPPPRQAHPARAQHWPRTETSLPWPEPSALISIRDLCVSFDDGSRLVPVLHGVNLDIHRGESLGIVGESGCGKSVTWMAILGLLGPRAHVSGDIVLQGTPLDPASRQSMARIRGKRIAMIFQDPAASLNPVHRIGNQVIEAIRLHRGLRGATARAEAIRLLDRVRIPNAAERMRAYPHELSGGMNQRVMIAMALAGEPDLLVADEPTTALDTTIQAQIIDLLREIRDDDGMALALISHDLGVIADTSDHVMVMYAGRVVEQAPASVIFRHPQHPYTQGLVAALPDLAAPRRRLVSIPGTVPEPGRLPAGCSFAPRCPQAAATCRSDTMPVLRRVAPDHHIACHRKT